MIRAEQGSALRILKQHLILMAWEDVGPAYGFLKNQLSGL
jgi:hypothetical protein